MQFFTGTSKYTQSISQMLSLTEYVWDFQNNTLWDETLINMPYCIERMNVGYIGSAHESMDCFLVQTKETTPVITPVSR